MKGNIKINNGRFSAYTGIITTALKHIAFACAAFLAAGGEALGTLPFGISLAGGAPLFFTPPAALGAAAGCLISNSDASFVSLVCVLTVAAARLIIGTAVKSASRPLGCAATVLAVTLSAGFITITNNSGTALSVICGSILSAGGAYFVCFAFKNPEAFVFGATPMELGSLLITVALIFTGLYKIGFASLSLGRILACTLVLITAKYGGAEAGTFCGVALGFSAMLSQANPVAIAYLSLGGMVSGFFAKLGRIKSVVIYLAVCFAIIMLTSGAGATPYFIEALLSAALFLLFPKSLGTYAGRLFAPPVSDTEPEGLKKSVIMRLNLASSTLEDVTETVEQVADELSKINSPEFSGVIRLIENDACKGCTLRQHCWEFKKDDTVHAVIQIITAIKSGADEPELSSTDEFKARCLRLKSIGIATKKNFAEYDLKIAAENRLNEVREVIYDEFLGISEMLTDLANEVDKGETFDCAAAKIISEAMREIDIRPTDCICKIDRMGRMFIEIRVKNAQDLTLNKIKIMNQAAAATERDFAVPYINKTETEAVITLNEKCVLDADVGVEQIISGGAKISGDAYRYFFDGRGKLVMIIADGMGTGGRAAVDGAMASGIMARLISAGFGYDCALRILNSSMLFKSTDESLSTVDIAVIDLFTGRTDLFKAGAAPTLVRRSGRTGKAQSTSLPAGILRDIHFDKATVRLKKGDIILLMSDGVVSEGTDWICAELESWQNGTAQQLCEHISDCAKRRRNDNHEDDITVLAAILKKAV